MRPLTDANILPKSWPLSVNAVSGYSGGGRKMIEEFEDKASPSFTKVPYRIYGLTLAHKHVPRNAGCMAGSNIRRFSSRRSAAMRRA